MVSDGFDKEGCARGIFMAICQRSFEQLKQITKTCENSHSLGLEDKLARAEYEAAIPAS